MVFAYEIGNCMPSTIQGSGDAGQGRKGSSAARYRPECAFRPRSLCTYSWIPDQPWRCSLPIMKVAVTPLESRISFSLGPKVFGKHPPGRDLVSKRDFAHDAEAVEVLADVERADCDEDVVGGSKMDVGLDGRGGSVHSLDEIRIYDIGCRPPGDRRRRGWRCGPCFPCAVHAPRAQRPQGRWRQG